MKKLYLIFTIFLIGIFNCGAAIAFDDSSYMSLEEYERFFELGFFDETPPDDIKNEEENAIQEKTGELKLKEKFDLESDVITLEEQPFKLNAGKTDFLDSYREVFKIEDSKNELLKTGNLTLFSDTTKELSDYMTNNYKSSMNMNYNVNNAVSLRAGQEIWYVNPDASLGSKKLYVNPSLNLTDNFSMGYTGRYNMTTKNIEQEVGLKYKPKLFKDSASFGVSASTVINENNQVQSKKVKFSTDLYFF